MWWEQIQTACEMARRTIVSLSRLMGNVCDPGVSKWWFLMSVNTTLLYSAERYKWEQWGSKITILALQNSGSRTPTGLFMLRRGWSWSLNLHIPTCRWEPGHFSSRLGARKIRRCGSRQYGPLTKWAAQMRWGGLCSLDLPSCLPGTLLLGLVVAKPLRVSISDGPRIL